MMQQTMAIFLDAYRELNARKMFWLVLILSGLVVVAFLCVNITDEGFLTVLVWETPLPLGRGVDKETFFKLIFINLGVGVWLSWIATILALVSTAPMIPDFISSGTIDLVLAKPISRLRLFMTKYLSGLLFVGLQVTVFSTMCFLVIGYKSGAWIPAIFVSIPVVVVFFSFLFSVCVLLGLITRSTIASLLLTLVFWFLLFSIHSVETGLLMGRTITELQVVATEREITVREDYLSDLRLEDGVEESRINKLESILQTRRDDLPEMIEWAEFFTTWQKVSYRIKTVLPKTEETISLLQRWLIDLGDLPGASDDNANNGFDMSAMNDPSNSVEISDEELGNRVTEEWNSRSVFWILGTSLIFEFFILSIASWIFCRRDF